MDEQAVLLVDDEEIILKTLEQVFRFKGYAPYCSLNGKGALELLQTHRFRVIFTDLRMPEMDGLELCRCMKEHDPDASVFALSAYVDAFTDDDFQAAGFDGRFRKPFNIDELLKACADGFERIEAKNLKERIGPDARRQYHRLMLKETVIAAVLRSQKDPSLVGSTLDCTDCTVSAGGMEVIINGNVEKGTDMQLHVGISGSSDTYIMDGVVRWASNLANPKDGVPLTRAGIKFLPTSRDIDRWGEFLAQPSLMKHIVPTKNTLD